MANTYQALRATRSPGASLRNVIANVIDWNEARRTRQILSQLSAHELDDIGLAKGDIDRIARRHS